MFICWSKLDRKIDNSLRKWPTSDSFQKPTLVGSGLSGLNKVVSALPSVTKINLLRQRYKLNFLTPPNNTQSLSFDLIIICLALVNDLEA